MPRRSIYDIIEEETFNPDEEFSRLRYKFEHEHNFGGLSLRSRASLKLFTQIDVKIRGTSIDLNDLMSRMSLSLNGSHKLDELFDFVEFIILLYDSDHFRDTYGIKQPYESILENINIILEKTNHKLINGKLGRIVVPKNAIVEQAAELLIPKDPEAALELLSYNHRSNKENINNKAKILASLGKMIEPLLKGDKKPGSSKDVAAYMLNEFNIRHNNVQDAKRNEKFMSLSNSEREEWYDKLYNTIISIVIEENQNKINSEVVAFRKKQ